MIFQKQRLINFLILLFVLTASTHLLAIEKNRVQVIMAGENQSVSVSVYEKGNTVYFPLAKLADLLNLRYFQNPKNKKMVLRVGSHALKVTADNPFIAIDDDVIQMPLPTLSMEEGLYVPLVLFLASTKSIFPQDFTFDRQEGELHVNQFRYNITGYDVEKKENGTIIRLITKKDFSQTDISTSYNRGWLYVTLMGGMLDTTSFISDHKNGIVENIVSFQFEKSAQVSFKLDAEITDRQIFTNTGEVLISLRTENKIEIPVHVPNANSDVRKQWLIDTIIIDPGHGGKHPGAIGPKGTREKGVVLDIAKRLKKLLRDRLKVNVLMTREGDTFIGLKERTQFANSKSGKLFISIHANGNKNKNVRGYSTWVLGQGKTKEALEVAEKENSVIEFEESVEAYNEYKNAAHILNAIAQSSYLKESLDLARMVNESMKKKTSIPQWGKGVYQAGFYVLIGAAMPSILVEAAFLTNSYEERLLKTRTFQQKVAEALYESIKKFKQKYEKGIG